MESFLKNSFLMFFLVVLILIIKNEFLNNIFYEENINNFNLIETYTFIEKIPEQDISSYRYN